MTEPRSHAVPLSQTLAMGQWDNLPIAWGTAGTTAGTADLKALARLVLARDTRRDSERDTVSQGRPIPPTFVGRPAAKPPTKYPGVDWWRECFKRRCRLQYGRLYTSEQAVALGYNQLIRAWHKRHGRRWPPWQCAGCDALIGGLPALDLADGNRVHLDRFDCVIAFGKRWRGEAVVGLRALGFDPPPDFGSIAMNTAHRDG
jgi:hypothetical protein